MTSTEQVAHTLVVEIVGRARNSDDDLGRSLAILSELVVACDVYRRGNVDRQLVTFPYRGGLTILFLSDSTGPVQCALELYETIRELPSMSVVMGIHSGPVAVEDRGAKGMEAVGDGVETARALVAEGEAGQILLSESYAATLKLDEVWAQKLFILHQGESDSDASKVGSVLINALTDDGHTLDGDLRPESGLAWAKSLEERIRSADVVVAIVSDQGEQSDLAQYELELAMDERRKRGKPQILPVWLNDGPSPGGPLGALNRNLRHAMWQSANDDARVVSEVRTVLARGQTEMEANRLDSGGGAVSSTSKFYVERPADREFENAILEHESIILVKGPRQIGKTSLIGRGIRFVDELGWRCAATDFQNLSTRQLASEDHFYRVIATSLSFALGFPFDPEEDWVDALGPNLNMLHFVRSLVASSDTPLVWFIDEADRLFTSPFASDFFGLVRSWHNARATDIRGPWSRLTIVIGYATEAHLFIEDLNQSPFNVGCAVPLAMFTPENTEDLNARYGRPIESVEDVRRLHALVGGQPFLTRRAFDVLVRKKMDFATLLATADQDDGPFGDHLKRVLVSVSKLPFVWAALWNSMSNPDPSDSDGLHRLVAAGVLRFTPQQGYHLACELYRRYLARYVEEA